MSDARDLYTRRHSDVLPKTKGYKAAPLLHRQVLTRIGNAESFHERTSSSLYDEYHQVADQKCHKAVERHTLQRKEDIISRHTTFFPKKLSEDEEIYSKSCKNHGIAAEYSYDLSKFPRGIMCLINEEMFYKSMGSDRRLGTDFDADELTSLFLDLGFIVQRYDNYTRKEMKMALTNDVNEDYSNMSCAAFCILSRGHGNEIFAVDKMFSISSITNIFDANNLNGIPKLFILNIEHGDEHMDDMESQGEEGGNETISNNAKTDMLKQEDTVDFPPGNDFIYAYSAIPGYYSWRNNTRGSWFLQSIISVFKENAHTMELCRMLTRVNRKVAKKLSRVERTDSSNCSGQMSVFLSRLRGDVFLCPPYGPVQLMTIPVKWSTQT